MDILGIILIVMIIAAMAVPAKRALHMFQQNRYETGRYVKWAKESTGVNAARAVLPLALVISGIITGLIFRETTGKIIQIVLLAMLAAYLFLEEKNKNYIKPLVFTGRVKRQCGVLAVLVLLLTFIIVKADLRFFCVPCAYLLPWLLIFPVAWITAPIEAQVRKWYLNDAKRILREHRDLIKIGITGSYGKTSTKNIMQAMISEQFNSLMTPASYNTPMGITRTIREMMKPIYQVFVCEMGADHVGDISELMDFVHPSIGVVTSIGPQHLNTFGSQENITREKMQMIEMLPADGFGILNYDNPFIRDYRIKNNVEVATYGIENKDVDYRAEDIVYTPHGSRFTVVHGDERVEIETKLLGGLNILNILSAVACARHLGVEWNVICRAARTMKQVEHRLELKTINGYRFIDDAFNANPSGSAMALDVLSMMPETRFIVTPGMIDLGPKQEEVNRHFGELMKDKTDYVVLVGEQQTRPILEGLKNSGFDMDHVLVVATVKEAFAFVYRTATPKDTILLENDLPDAFSH